MASSTVKLTETQKEKKGVMPNNSELLKTEVDKGGRPGFECKKARCCKLFHSKRIFMIHIKNHEKVREKGDTESETTEEEVNVDLLANNLTCANGPTKPELPSKRKQTFRRNSAHFSRKTSYFGDHINRHSKKPFSSKNGVRNHLSSHSLKHRCTQHSCDKVFPIRSQLQKHMLTHKAPLERPNYFCDLCESNRIYLTAHGFKRHLRIHHSETGANQCSFCRKLFESEEKLVEHLRESGHHKEKEFSCVICNQRFSLRRTLQRHLKTNSHIVKDTLYKNAAIDANMRKDLAQNKMNLVASFPCKKCESTFSSVKELKKHYNSVHNSSAKERSFICQVEGCTKACLTEKNLSIHIKEMHEQVRKLKCEKCGQKFKRMTHLKIHMNTKWPRTVWLVGGDGQPEMKTKCMRKQSNELQKSSKPGMVTTQKTRISERIRNKGK